MFLATDLELPLQLMRRTVHGGLRFTTCHMDTRQHGGVLRLRVACIQVHCIRLHFQHGKMRGGTCLQVRVSHHQT